ncbi:hypothetical protein B7R54_13925 [Subtercola boreus]|uniref:Metallo-beta-lactamase domain-containing protein n=1 Tax=Subtercola boreus TaxID=120213 RepID=A0A3E0VJP7_9MICO|nr:MBL fold metallo-hydrolase [Subtercola boreus]RFA10184.1 hypothetical protein B7R54_13925 [Subtercola boreus]TQL52650.1 glyoxylase-like metal-dependent hydrolase (beta-lactamase superfamily II) [Subtercola boreus]
MQPTSPIQFTATANGTVPPLEEIGEGVWALPQAMPNPQLPYTLCYLIVDAEDRVHIIDPAWDSDENFAALEHALAEIGSSVGRIASATMTHMHIDHIGLAGRLQEAFGARIGLSGIDQEAIAEQALVPAISYSDDDFTRWGVPDDERPALESTFLSEAAIVDTRADLLLQPGDTLDIPGRSIRVLATPGHTAGSVCFADEDARLLFTGDHVLPMIFPGIGLGGRMPGNPVTTYIDSLEQLEPFDDWEVLPGHGYRFTGLGERRRQTAEHHDRRTREAAAVLSGHPEATVWQVAGQLHWTAGWDGLAGSYRRSALAQTEMHSGRVRNGDWERYLSR